MYLGGHHGVPFASRGTVVGVHDSGVEVLFDMPIVSGTNLHSRFVLSAVIIPN